MKTECSIVRDLLPLYVEEMVSGETDAYIKKHLAACPECMAELEQLRSEGAIKANEGATASPATESGTFKKIMKRMNTRFHMLAYSLIVFFIFLGFSWTEGDKLMYNSLIMPLVGIFSYYVFGWRAAYKAPILLLAIDLAVYAFGLVETDFSGVILWTLLYSVFVLVGVAIAFLLHYAFKKEECK